MTKTSPGLEGPVTVTIARRVKPGHEAEYESWIDGITKVAQTFPGHMGISALPPSDVTAGDYVIIFRYDTYEHLREWEESEERAAWLSKLEGLVEGDARIQRVTGLEFLFPLAEVPAATPPPSPHKMAAILIVVVFCLVTAINLVFGHWLAQLPLLARILVLVTLQVLLMTYVVMPRVTRLLKPWLYGTRD